MGLLSFDTFRGFLNSTNIFQRISVIGEKLQKEYADVILLQEVHTYFNLHQIKNKLTSYPHVAYTPYLYGPRGGLVIFSKYPFESVAYINYNKQGSIFNKSIVARIIQNGILSTKIKNKQLFILNTYLTPNMDYDHTKKNRFTQFNETQLTQLAQVGKTLTKNNGHVIIGGDFNIDKKGYLYKFFCNLSQATDLFKQYNFPTKHQEFYPKNRIVERLDYIFHLGKIKPIILSTKHLFTKKIQVNKSKLTYLSDHIALKTTVKL